MNESSNIAVKPKLLLLVGIPGAGKTFFAEKFSSEYQIPFINLNDWRYNLFDQPTFDRQEDAKLFNFGQSILEQIFKTRKSVLIEGGLDSRTDRQRYINLARQNNYEPMVIWVQNVEQESRIRATRLNKKLPKQFLITSEAFDNTIRRFTAPNIAEKPVVISGKHAFSTQYRTILKRIVEQRSAVSSTVAKDFRAANGLLSSHRPVIR